MARWFVSMLKTKHSKFEYSKVQIIFRLALWDLNKLNIEHCGTMQSLMKI